MNSAANSHMEKEWKKKKSGLNLITCGRVNPDSFEFDDVEKSCPVSNQTINQYGGSTCRPSLSGVNPDSTGCGGQSS